MMILSFMVFFAGINSATSEYDRPELAIARIPKALIEDAHSVIRESITTLDISSEQEYRYSVRETVSILDKRSKYDALAVPYNQYSKAKIASALAYDQYGKLIRKFRKEDLIDASAFGGSTLYADSRVLVIEMTGGGYPYTISYEYEIVYQQTQYYPDWEAQSYNTSVERAEFRLIHPESISIETMTQNGPTVASDSITDKRKRERVWVISGAKAVRIETMGPPAHTLLPALYLAPESFKVEEHAGSMSDWKQFGKFIYDLNAGKDELSPQMAEMVKRMTASATDNKSKIDILYRYLQQNMRYVSVQLGIGGWQVYDAKYVEQNKYGDCKALSYFMKGMLAEAGINAWPVLISLSDAPQYFREDFVTPGSFNHMILYLPDEDLWLECTSKLNPTGYLHDVTNDRNVLCITPSGGIISKTPSTSIDNTLIQTRDSIYFSDASWHLNGARRFEEAAHELYRSILSYLTITEQEKKFRENFTLPVKQLTSMEYSAEKDLRVAGCNYNVVLTQLGSVSGSRMFLPVNPLYRFETPCATDSRTHEICWNDPTHESNEIFLEIPEGYTIESAISDKHVTDPVFGEYKMSISVDGRQIHIRRLLRIPRFSVAADQYSAICTFFTTVQASDRGTIVLKKRVE